MVDATLGQYSDPNKKMITYAKHIDYEKWNNHQIGEAVNPVFMVMEEFFGLPKLFVRRHEFFQDSLIYYNGRPYLIKWKGYGSSLNVDESNQHGMATRGV